MLGIVAAFLAGLILTPTVLGLALVAGYAPRWFRLYDEEDHGE